MSKIAGVTVIYNPDNKVIKNICTYVNLLEELFVIDNSESIDYDIINDIKKINGVQYIWMKGNQGIASALNCGIYECIEKNYDWVLTMDQDSQFNNNLLAIYRNYLDDKDTSSIAILSPQYMTPRSDAKYKKGQDELYWTMQSANLLNLKVMKKIGFYDEKYFIDCVDYEYCLRAKRNGYKIIRCNKAILIHNPGITKYKKILGINIKYGYASPVRIYYQIRNALYMYKKYGNIRSLCIVAIKLLKIILFYDNKKEFFTFAIRGISDYKNNVCGKIKL